jgi:tripartite-type tricarboxylate transporter receptor subunit TctC
MASAGIGGTQHIAGELFKSLAGIDMTHVPYRGSTPAITDLIGGQVDVMFDVVPTALPVVQSGKLRALGVTTKTRHPSLPDVPPISDFVKDYEATAWLGIGAPRNTPLEILNLLNKSFNEALADPGIRKRILDTGADVPPAHSQSEFAAHVGRDADKWSRVIKAAGIKPQ